MSSLPPSMQKTASPNQNDAIGSPLSLKGSDFSVVFNNLEHPEKIEFPVEQKIAVSELLGGKRIVQMLGLQPQPITWAGKLFNQNVVSRIKTLLSMANSGNVYLLSYLSFAYNVVIKSFKPGFYHEWYGEYEITVEVVSDQSGSISSPTVSSIDGTLDTLNANGQNNFNTLQSIVPSNPTENALVPSTAMTTAYNNVLSSYAAMGPYNSASNASVQTCVVNLNVFLQLIAAYNALISSLMNSGYMSLNVLTAFQQGNQLASSFQLIQDNLQNGQAPVVITLIGGNLFSIAAEYYNDASLFTLLMQANNLQSPILPSGVSTTLTVPFNPNS